MARPKKQINPEGYYTIFNWMSTDLELSGSKLLVYAFIYAYSTNEKGKGCYFGGYEAMSLSVGCGVKTLRNITKTLCIDGLIEQKKAVLSNGLERNYFRVSVNPLFKLCGLETIEKSLITIKEFDAVWEDLKTLSKSIASVKTNGSDDINRFF